MNFKDIVNLFKNKKLLVITNGYPSKDGKIPNCTFVKHRLDALQNFFKKIVVISPTSYFPKFLANTNIFPTSYEDVTKLEHYKYNNIEVYFPKYLNIPYSFFLERRGDWVFFFLKRFIKRLDIDFDFIHAYFTWFSGYLSMRLSRMTKKPYFLTIQENRNWFLEIYTSNREKYYQIWGNAKKLIRVNKRDVPLLKRFNKSTVSLPNGYNNKIFKNLNKENCKEKLGIPNDKKILLHVGSYIQNHKNQLTIIRACNLLRHKIKDFICYLVGEGEDRILFQKEIEKLNLEKHIKLIGRIPNKYIPIWMNAANLFIFPSHAEGNPTVVVEAMACGLPIIGSKGGGMDEIIIEDEIGYILNDEDDEIELMEKILKGLDKKWEYEKIFDEAKKYSQKNLSRKLLRIYFESLNF